MTTNAGARGMTDQQAIGFGARSEANAGKALSAVEKTFSPEFATDLTRWFALMRCPSR